MKSYTKALSLNRIKLIKGINVPKFIFFKKSSFLNKKNFYLKKIKKEFKSDIIIRSSAINEDSNKESKAGFYDSYMIQKKNFSQIEFYIQKIIKKFLNKNDEIIIQTFITKPDITGVLFTKDKNTNSNYYNINYDTSKKSNLITSGHYNPTMKLLIINKHVSKIPKKFKNLINISLKLEKIFYNNRLDIEFCIKNNKTFILQTRPLHGTKVKVNKKNLNEIITNLKKKFKKISQPNQTLFGNTTVFSNMSDWNPAEIIGKKPTKLSSSLYAELVTDNVWSKQRSEYGYKNVYPNKLMLDMAGSPYIDLRVDLNSFLPNELNKNISKKLINFYVNKISKKPELHDKIEFELIPTCYDFGSIVKNLKILNNIEKKEYSILLLKLTNKILDKKRNLLNKEINKINILKNKIKSIQRNELSHIQKIFYLIEDCKQYGTLPFAGIARCAFIGKTILDNLKKNNLLTENDIDDFYRSLNTISKEINKAYLLSERKNNFKRFITEYGHLRPSTYSITAKNYKDNFKNYFSKKNKKLKLSNTKKIFRANNDKIKKIDNYFKQHKLEISFRDFLKFTRISTENREYAKLIFTKSIDEIFKNLKKLANEIDIDFNELEHLDIKIILNAINNLGQDKLKKIILDNIKSNKRSFKFSRFVLTPDFVKDQNDFDFFHEIDTKENYITNKIVHGEILLLKKKIDYQLLNNKIIIIENADPGFDFLFSHNIKGLITKYGGANSHMAIRCMELGLPAIIGLGTKKYLELVNVKKIFIDCRNKNYSIIQ